MDVLGIGSSLSSSGETKLKHLGFVKILVKAAMVILSWLYQFAKAKFIYYVITPLYNKAKAIFFQVLSFLDIKIDEKAPATVKNVLDRIDQIVNMLSNLWSTIQLQIKLVGPQNAMKIFGTFIKNFIVSTLLPMLAKNLFKIPGLSSALEMSFPNLSLASDKLSESLSKITSTIPGMDKLPKVPVPDLGSAFKQVGEAAAAAPRNLDVNVVDDMTKAFEKVGVTPSVNFIGDLTNPFSKPTGTPKPQPEPEESQKNGTTSNPSNNSKNLLGLNILEDLTKNTLNVAGLAPKNDDNGITEEK